MTKKKKAKKKKILKEVEEIAEDVEEDVKEAVEKTSSKIIKTFKKFNKISSPPVLLISLFLIAAIILLPTKVVIYQAETSYIDKEQYQEEVPYEDIEEYIEKVPYQTTETYIESVPYTEQEAYTINEVLIETDCDYNPGCTCFDWSIWTGKCKKCNCEVTRYRTVTKYKDVVKERSVTLYRDETKYRKTTETRTEMREREVIKKGMEDRKKEVNWLFGFDAIIKFRNLDS